MKVRRAVILGHISPPKRSTVSYSRYSFSRHSSQRSSFTTFRQQNKNTTRNLSMTDTTVNIGTVLSVCIDAAQRAGNVIRNVWKSGELDIKDKGNDDPFTQADIKSQQLIMGLLYKKWPSIKTIGEEDVEIPPSSEKDEPKENLVDMSKVPKEFTQVPLSELCIFIDPLDATKEFTLGNLEAVITLVGISYKGVPVAGVMYQPFVDDEHGNGTTIWGMKGMGCFGYKYHNRNDGKVVLTTTRTHSDEHVERAISLIKPDVVLKVGGAGYKALLVLEGKADVYVFATKGTKKWDTCAPEALLRAAGGELTDTKGRPYQYFQDSEVQNLDGLIATLQNHNKFVELLNPKA